MKEAFDMNIRPSAAMERSEKMLLLRTELLSAEEERKRGETGYSPAETAAMMRAAAKAVSDGKQKTAL